MIYIASLGLDQALQPHAAAWLGVVPEVRFRAGSNRLKQLVDETGPGGGANVTALTDLGDAIDADRDWAITGEDALAAQHLIEAISRNGGT